jgi:hypothetical protein
LAETWNTQEGFTGANTRSHPTTGADDERSDDNVVIDDNYRY